MKIFIAVCTTLFLLGFQGSMEEVTKSELKLIPHSVLYNDMDYVLQQAVDPMGVSQYYFIDIAAFPCKSSKECKLTQFRMYWDVNGFFLSIELERDTPLTKLNHKEFTTKDYLKLHRILLDDSSDFKFLTLKDLTERQAENSFYQTDATSGATINSRDFECIHGAVKTTYQLWHFANGSLKDRIKEIEEKQEDWHLNARGDFKKNEEKIIRGDSLIDENIRAFTEYLSSVKLTTKKEQLVLENVASHILLKGGRHGVMMYNFLVRNELKMAKRAKHHFFKRLLIKQIML
ncbi:MAG: hypothetical protein JKY08_05295 [Flavobacteriaceae bacterium]|nr:hypothetical protein [Flavobacteriaceae bacterium]